MSHTPVVWIKKSGWNGKRATYGARTHADTCRFVHKFRDSYWEIEAHRIPRETPRCHFCGGGER